MSRICNYSSLLSVHLNTNMISNRNLTRKGQDPRVGDPGLISFHEHTKTTTIHRATIPEKDLKTSTKDFPQLKIKGKSPLR